MYIYLGEAIEPGAADSSSLSGAQSPSGGVRPSYYNYVG